MYNIRGKEDLIQLFKTFYKTSLTGQYEMKDMFVFGSVFTETLFNSGPKHGKIIDFVSAKQREVSLKVAKKTK